MRLLNAPATSLRFVAPVALLAALVLTAAPAQSEESSGGSYTMQIQGFSVSYYQTSGGSWIYTFSGTVLGSDVTQTTVDIYGGPFNDTAYPGADGYFEVTFEYGDVNPITDVVVYATVYKGQTAVSATENVYV